MGGGFSETRVFENESISFDRDTFEPDNKVLLRFVDSFRKSEAVKKTQLQLASKLRWDLFSKYWEWLHSQDYIKCIDMIERKNEFLLTPKGNELFNLFLNYYTFMNKHNELLIQKM